MFYTLLYIQVWEECYSNYEDLLDLLLKNCRMLIDSYLSNDKSWSVKYSTFNNKCNSNDLSYILKKLDPIFINSGPVNLSNPDTRIIILEDYHLNKATNYKKLKRIYFGNIICDYNNVEYVWCKYNLSKRPILGPTTTDNTLAFLMCNLAQVGNNKIVFDPFVGSGGILITASSLGAFCIGTDIDARILKGWGISYKNPNFIGDVTSTDVFYNFHHYNLSTPEIIRVDNRNSPWGYSRQWIDVIVTDPPYGIRASARHSKLSKLLYKNDYNDNTSEGLINILLDLAESLLVNGGFLVFLLPSVQNSCVFTPTNYLPHFCSINKSLRLLSRNKFEIKHIGQQKLSSGTCRFIVVLKKIF